MRLRSWFVIPALLLALRGSQAIATATAGTPLGDVVEFSRDGDTFSLWTSTGAVVRILVLRSDVFRIWVGPDGKLVDEGSHAAPIVVDSTHTPVNAQLDSTGDHRTIATGDFALVVNSSPLRFALYRPDRTTPIWRELKPMHLAEDGSYQTLGSSADERFFGGGQQNGFFEFKGRVMEIAYSDGWEEGDRPNPAPFYMSSTGYGVLRNTWTDGRYDFWSADYLTTTHQEYRFDAYYLVGSSIHHVLDLYTRLTGRAGLLPRWAFEYGDADCYNDRDNVDKPGTVPGGWTDGPTGTTPDVIEAVAAKYRQHDMPGGWILPNDGYGCGYTDLPGVVESLRRHGFHTGLWTESGLEKIAWEVGQAGTRVQKLDVAWTGKGYQFALDANMEAAQGILENSDSRPFVWTVMGWAGIQRYAVTWTGDQSGSWDYIRWHVPTLIGSGLSGMIYSTGDVDGIYGGSPETFTRDLQWKCFTPVMMGMSGWSKAERKHPWWFEEPYRSINRKFLKLKMRLMPLLYTLAREAEQTGAPIVRGLLWDHPDDPHAFGDIAKHQFLLGRDLLIAPVFRSQSASGGWRDHVYLPEGEWVDFWDGTVSRAGSEGLLFDYPVTLDKLPVFVRSGAILPLYPEALYDGQVAKDVLTLDIYPSGQSEFALYEDDGNTRAYKDGEFSLQRFVVSCGGDAPSGIHISLEPARGQFKGMYERRWFVLQVHSHAAPSAVSVDGQPLARVESPSDFERVPRGWYFAADDRRGVVYVKTDAVSVRDAHDIVLLVDSTPLSVYAAAYPIHPRGDGTVAADRLLVVNRPAEEPGYPLENALDGDPATWFRTVRDQATSYGPHEFVFALKERCVLDGFTIAPRTDKWWKYGQVYRYELYVSEANGNWGEPIVRDTLALVEGPQTVRFAPTAGRVVRFRVLSAHEVDIDSTASRQAEGPFDALAPIAVKPISISELQLLEHQVPAAPGVTRYLSDEQWRLAKCSAGKVVKHGTRDGAGAALQMNGLPFEIGLTVRGNSRIDYRLRGDWQTLRVEAGIDDRSRNAHDVRFQVYGDDSLRYDSGPVNASSIAKLEVDIRGITSLSLRTVDPTERATLHWAGATIRGFAGDQVGD